MKALAFFLSLLSFFISSCSGNSSENGMTNQDNDNSNQFNCDVLSSGLSFPFDGNAGFGLGRMLSDDTHIYWYDYNSSSGSLKKISKSGENLIALVNGIGSANDFVNDDTHIYWTDYDDASGEGSIKKVNTTDGTLSILASGYPEQPDGSTSPYNIFFPLSIAEDTEQICFGEQVGGGAIRCVPKNGGAVQDYGRGMNFIPQSLVMDIDYFYILDTQNNGMLLRLSRANEHLDTLTTGFASSQGLSSLILHTDMLYWVELIENGPVFRLPKTGGSLEVIDDGLSIPRQVLIAENTIYYVAGNGVFKQDISNGNPERAFQCSNMNNAVNIAVDAASIYIVDGGGNQAGNGQILKTAK